jgi:N-acetylglutamate synthase/N-acetylornithine aminotransferase
MRINIQVWGFVLAFSLTGCVTTLAPSYDQAIVDGLTSTNAQIMELFASAESGTTKKSFSDRSKSYYKIIGRLDALAIQAKARPIPMNQATEKVNAYLSKRSVAVLDTGVAPSATAIEKISATVSKMKSTDQKQGVTAFEVLTFKKQASTYLDQALTYESFLKR